MSEMSYRYLLCDYELATDETPRVAFRSDELEKATDAFKTSGERKINSTVLYDTQQDEILNIAIEGEPINLVRAVQLARSMENTADAVEHDLHNRALKIKAGLVIGEIVRLLAGEGVPGVGGAIVGHILGPYYAMKGDGVGVAKAGAGVWGALAGGIFGALAGGPVGAVVGGVIGGMAAGEGAGAIVKHFAHPDSCKHCQGAGLVDDYRTCLECKGYGYRK